LKDYHLCEDLTRLNHDDYFHSHFQAPELYEAICGPASFEEFREQSRNRCIYFLNLAHTDDKNVFIVLKWLLVAHQIAKGARHARVVREMEEALGKINQPKPGSKYERYLFDRLVKPYRHYLQKLCLLLEGRTASRERTEIQEWFMKYNLLKYALYEFCPVLGEFTPFFQDNYPFLARIAVEVGLDTERFMRELRAGYKKQELKYVERH
jgi:hypothetical protein